MLENLLQNFDLPDAVALILMLVAWLGSTYFIEKPNGARKSTHVLMTDYRFKWMQQMITRQPRMFDVNMLAIMRQGTAFFASSCMIAIGGGIALFGSTEQLTILAGDISPELSAPRFVWELKILLLMVLLANGFLKFVWAMRLFGYCAIVMAAVPNDPEDPETEPLARKAAQLANYGSTSFNRGLRSVYFSIASLTWLIGSGAFIVAILVTLWVLFRREFASRSRGTLAS